MNNIKMSGLGYYKRAKGHYPMFNKRFQDNQDSYKSIHQQLGNNDKQDIIDINRY